MKVYGVIGDPIEHSKSPQMQNAALRNAGIDAIYTKFHITDNKLDEAIQGFRRLRIAGFNVTVPHKITVMKHLDNVDELAQDIGAVNTVHNDNGKLIGYNTDGYGALESIKKVTTTEGKGVCVLGAGGAARAIAFTLASESKPKEVYILNRTKEKAEKLAKEIAEKTGVRITGAGLDETDILERTDILINTTSVGMHPKTGESPLPKEALHSEMVVFDIVYNPLKTRLLMDAEEKGCRIITGENMLIMQGAKAFEIWTGGKPDLDSMRFGFGNKEQTKNNIALLGFMGTGKTTVGKLLAKKTGKEFVDLDDEIEKMAEMKISKIFEKYGEERFRILEREVVGISSKKNNSVLSCGGGVVLNIINIARLNESCQVFLLTATPQEIMKRLHNVKNRPLLGESEEEKEKKIGEIMEVRKIYYAASGAIGINTTGLQPKEVAEQILQRLKNE